MGWPMVNTRHVALGLVAAALGLVSLPIGQAMASDTIRFSPVAPAATAASGWLGNGQYSLPPGIGAVTMSVSAIGGTATDAGGQQVQAFDITLTVGNRGDQSLSLDPADARLADSRGRLLVGGTAFSGSTVASAITIAPGGRDKLQLVFYLPASSRLADLSTASIHWPYSYANEMYAVNLEFTQGSAISNAPIGPAAVNAPISPMVANAPGDYLYGTPPESAADYATQASYDSLIYSSLPYYGTTWGYGPGYWDWWFNPQPVWWGANFSSFGGFGFPFFVVGHGRPEFHEFLEHRRGFGSFLSQHNAWAGGDSTFRTVTGNRSLFAPLAANRSRTFVGQSQRLDSIAGPDFTGFRSQAVNVTNGTGRGMIQNASRSFGTTSRIGGSWTAGSNGNVPRSQFVNAPLTPILPPRFNNSFTPRFQGGGNTFAAPRQFSTSNSFSGPRVFSAPHAFAPSGGGSSFVAPHISSAPGFSHSFGGGSSFVAPHVSSAPSFSHSFGGGGGGGGGGFHGGGMGGGGHGGGRGGDHR